jgi:hypothetical protein
LRTSSARRATTRSPVERGVERIPESSAPALLVSYAYLEPFERERHRFVFRDWALDSGAFTAHAAGKEVDLAAYIDTRLRLSEHDPQLVEVFALDVIGDWEASARNAEEMRRQGVEAIPCYHHGGAEDALLEMARTHDKIALGGVARMREKKRTAWVAQCFARVWPKKVHGFGMATRGLVLGFPFHSVDATSWELGPCGFGRWASFGRMSVRGSNQNLRTEVEWYMALEREARSRWRREMEQVAALPGTPPVVRLATKANSGQERKNLG